MFITEKKKKRTLAKSLRQRILINKREAMSRTSVGRQNSKWNFRTKWWSSENKATFTFQWRETRKVIFHAYLTYFKPQALRVTVGVSLSRFSYQADDFVLGYRALFKPQWSEHLFT